jgi:hypothetical protein
MDFKKNSSHLLQRQCTKIEARVSLGPESARLGSRHGGDHF